MGIYDVPASSLIKEVAKDLKGKIEKPAWVEFVKTGVSKERAPQDRDFWFARNASLLFRIYKDGPVGTGSLRSYYGGRKNRGLKPERHRKGSGKVIRTCLQTLEKSGYIKKSKKGRVITSAGEKYLYAMSKIVEKNIAERPVEVRERKIEAQPTKSREVEETLRMLGKKDRPKDKEDEKKKPKAENK